MLLQILQKYTLNYIIVFHNSIICKIFIHRLLILTIILSIKILEGATKKKE